MTRKLRLKLIPGRLFDDHMDGIIKIYSLFSHVQIRAGDFINKKSKKGRETGGISVDVAYCNTLPACLFVGWLAGFLVPWSGNSSASRSGSSRPREFHRHEHRACMASSRLKFVSLTGDRLQS